MRVILSTQQLNSRSMTILKPLNLSKKDENGKKE